MAEATQGFITRKYQEEIFVAARQRNIVAAMDTGSGKTYIAALLIRWIASLPSTDRKIIVFLVPKVPLVEQQAAFIESQIPLRVKRYFGQMGVDLWDRSRWEREFEEVDILVMTAQIYKDLIAHSHWSIAKTSLIIFDEAHHCCKNHVYNQIMRDHYFHTPVDQRPRIFGMTASPIWNPKNSAQALQELERNMDVKVLAVKENTMELAKHSPRPTEVILDYDLPPLVYEAYPSPSLWDELDAKGMLPIDPDKPFELESRYAVALENLGPCGADRYLLVEMDRRMNVVEKNQPRPDPTAMAVDEEHTVMWQIKRIRTVLESRRYLKLNEKQISPLWLCPKMRLLVRELVSHKSPTFQAIIFVEQRHVAYTLSWILNGVPELKGWIRSAPLVGHGESTAGRANPENSRGMGFKDQQDIVREFRQMKFNVLVATSVAEEGLDFQACHLIVIYDVFKTLTSYVQSRGRARRQDSVYVVMLPAGSGPDRERYKLYQASEPELEKMYRRGLPASMLHEPEEDDDEIDIRNRERYVVQSTGAVLTYDSAIQLLNTLCAIIPRDHYTKTLQPTYTLRDGYIVEVQLPPALPLPREKLVYTGLPRRTKKEAKRSAAFQAVRALQIGFQVFDDYLLPARGDRADDAEDADGNKPVDVSNVLDIMDVRVRDCWGDMWRDGASIYLHSVQVEGEGGVMGLVCGYRFDAMDTMMEVMEKQLMVHFGAGVLMEWESDEERTSSMKLVSRFTKRGIAYGVTSCQILPELACLYVPLDSGLCVPDYDYMETILEHEINPDWSLISPQFCGLTLLALGSLQSRIFLLHSFRPDLRAYDLEGKYPRGLQRAIEKGLISIDPSDPVIEVRLVERNISRSYRVGKGSAREAKPKDNTLLLPQTACLWISFPYVLAKKYRLFPPVTRYMMDVFRVKSIHKHLRLPHIDFQHCIEALTLPCANAGFSNQRFETYGDAVLKLATAVYVFNKYEHRHEGQLSVLRSHSVSNRSLLGKAKKIGLEQFLTSEVSKVRKPYGPLVVDMDYVDDEPFVRRQFPRRSLQDCMEALLGAGYATGGINRALEVGSVLGMCFGGPTPWTERENFLLKDYPEPSGHLYKTLEDSLGYTFRHGRLLKEALTHPTFQNSDTPSYQRLEFLGDALIDVVVTDYLFSKFPNATPGQLSWCRSRAVCSPALAAIAVKRLSLHKYVLSDSVTLSRAIDQSLHTLLELSDEQLVLSVWKMDPPKATSDLFEAVMGAVLIDSGYDMEVSSRVILGVMGGVLDVLSPTLPLDPTSELMIWIARQGCVKTYFRKESSIPSSNRKDMAFVVVHDIDIGGPTYAENAASARARASERAHQLLSDETSELWINRICDCERNKNSTIRLDTVERVGNEAPGAETAEGFAMRAREKLKEVEGDQPNQTEPGGEPESEGEDEEAVAARKVRKQFGW